MTPRVLVICVAICIGFTVLRLTTPQPDLLDLSSTLDRSIGEPLSLTITAKAPSAEQPKTSSSSRLQYEILQQQRQLTSQIPIFQASASANAGKTHWCVIGRHSNGKAARRFFAHFPHAAEALLPCWSWWRRQQAEERCGLVLLDQLPFPPDSWQAQLVARWGCAVKRSQNLQIRNRTHPIPDPNGVFYTPNLKWMQPRIGRINYIERPEDAWALRRLFISDEQIVETKRGVLQIGIIQRPGPGRVITNLQDIIQELERRIPEATITLSELKGLTLPQQAHWFATKDIIIAAHGAALVNCVFILPHTTVMQLYPHGYFFQSLEPLIESVGGIALDWFNGTDPVHDWSDMKRDGRQNEMREGNITPPVNEVVDPILMILGKMKTPSGWRNQVGVSTNWSKVLPWMD